MSEDTQEIEIDRTFKAIGELAERLTKYQKMEDEIPDPPGFEEKIYRIMKINFAIGLKESAPKIDHKELAETSDPRQEAYNKIERGILELSRRLGYDKTESDPNEDLSWPVKSQAGNVVIRLAREIACACEDLRLEHLPYQRRIDIVFRLINFCKQLETEFPEARKAEKLGWFGRFKMGKRIKYYHVDYACSTFEDVITFHSQWFGLDRRHLWFGLKLWLGWKWRRLRRWFRHWLKY